MSTPKKRQKHQQLLAYWRTGRKKWIFLEISYLSHKWCCTPSRSRTARRNRRLGGYRLSWTQSPCWWCTHSALLGWSPGRAAGEHKEAPLRGCLVPLDTDKHWQTMPPTNKRVRAKRANTSVFVCCPSLAEDKYKSYEWWTTGRGVWLKKLLF